MNIEVARPLFEKLWNQVLEVYFQEELGLPYVDFRTPPHSMNQVLGNASWSKNSTFEKQQKRQLPAFVGQATHRKSLELHEKGIGPETYKFGGSTFRDRHDDLLKSAKTHIGTTDHFMLALVRTLGFSTLDDYRQAHGFEAASVRTGLTKAPSDASQWENQSAALTSELQQLNQTHKKLRQTEKWWKVAAAMACMGLLTVVGWGWFFNREKTEGKVIRSIADTTTLAKGVIGNWYSYNRSYEARGKDDGYTFNRMAWQISVDNHGYLALKRYWKAIEFDGWTEFISGTTPQLHFFINVYQYGSGYKNPVGYRHFNCGIWGENADWMHADTLSCVCTTYNFSDSHLGEPLAGREILIRQPRTSFDSIKAGAQSLTASEAPWLERFLPKGDSYLFQKPKGKK
ncbi:hypothetical protein [Runella sp.]|jgi:hypothetical protein|uniref:hypothetical protein n=1 Tax=Runella sp. TaxID=1960881 RepID=UPI002606F832|nr:hypothetical protein [Runella sp.]